MAVVQWRHRPPTGGRRSAGLPRKGAWVAYSAATSSSPPGHSSPRAACRVPRAACRVPRCAGCPTTDDTAQDRLLGAQHRGHWSGPAHGLSRDVARTTLDRRSKHRHRNAIRQRGGRQNPRACPRGADAQRGSDRSTSSATTRASKSATTTVPIVMLASANAVAEGFVASLARAGGNGTGMTLLAGPEIASKQLELLREITPAASRIAVPVNPRNASHAAFTAELKAASRRIGVQLQPVSAASPHQLEDAFDAIAKDLHPPAVRPGRVLSPRPGCCGPGRARQ